MLNYLSTNKGVSCFIIAPKHAAASHWNDMPLPLDNTTVIYVCSRIYSANLKARNPSVGEGNPHYREHSTTSGESSC